MSYSDSEVKHELRIHVQRAHIVTAMRRGAPHARKTPTCENKAEMLLLFSVLNIIIITTYIMIIYQDYTWFPHPMVEHTSNNEYDIRMCAIFELLDRFETEEQLFAAQCICWLASIILFTEILIYNHHYQIFPSDYVIIFVVTPIQIKYPKKY